MKEYTLVITFKCNWNCNYCIVDTHNQPEISMDRIMKHIEGIDNNSFVSLQGGEPGMLSSKDMKTIFDALNEKNTKIHVSTNGLFIEKHKEFLKDVSIISYHCSEDLDTAKGIDTYDLTEYGVELDYLLTVTDSNYSNIGYFLDTYPDIDFAIFGADKAMVNGKEGHFLSKVNAMKIVSKYKNRITPDSITTLLSRSTTAEMLV